MRPGAWAQEPQPRLSSPLVASAPPTSRTPHPEPRKLPPLAEELVIAQWPLYIDQVKGSSPTLKMFERRTGIDTTYKEVINDNQEFFAKLREPLSRGRDTGWDIITLSDWVVAKMVRLGWLEPLDYSLLPNVKANLGTTFADPAYDPGNAHSVPWQGGITGIAFNPSLTGRNITAFADLWDESLAGHVGMLTEMVDTMSITLLTMGVDLEQATIDDAERAQERLLRQRDAGIVRGYYGNNYANGLARGDLWATMAWSGDVFQLQLDDPDLKFVSSRRGRHVVGHATGDSTGREAPARRARFHGLCLPTRDRCPDRRVGRLHHAGAGGSGSDQGACPGGQEQGRPGLPRDAREQPISLSYGRDAVSAA